MTEIPGCEFGCDHLNTEAQISALTEERDAAIEGLNRITKADGIDNRLTLALREIERLRVLAAKRFEEWEAKDAELHAAQSEIAALREALADLCDAWDFTHQAPDSGGKYRGNITQAHSAARAALAGEK